MLAIHERKNSFSDFWIEYCSNKCIPFKIVNCYSSDVISQLDGVSGLMWHWSHSDAKAALFARQLIASIEAMGVKVFPNLNTSWHYDDKIGQKYLLEGLKEPLVPSHVFFDEVSAVEWSRKTSYPKIFKLRSGAGSSNVKMAKNEKTSIRWIKQSFRSGWLVNPRLHRLREQIWHIKRDKSLASISKIPYSLARIFIRNRDERANRVEKGYVYFQNFIPDNDHDIRVVVIGRRAFAIKRLAREGDFRASGSGIIIYDPSLIPLSCVDVAFKASRKLRTQSIAFDFVFQDNAPLIVEISYAFSAKAYEECPGYWDEELSWHQEPVRPEKFIIEDFVSEVSIV